MTDFNSFTIQLIHNSRFFHVPDVVYSFYRFKTQYKNKNKKKRQFKKRWNKYSNNYMKTNTQSNEMN